MSKVPVWFRVVAVVAVIWNAFGVLMYLRGVGVFGDPTAGMSARDKAVADSIPAVITGAFAIGTFAGLIGALALVIARAIAVPLLYVSLVALFVLEGWILFLSGAVETFGVGVPVMVMTGAVLIAWLASHARKRGWLH